MSSIDIQIQTIASNDDVAIPRTVLVTLSGEVDLETISQLDQRLRSVLQGGAPGLLVIDLAGCSYIASLGIGVLMAIQKDLNDAGGKMRLAALQPMMTESLQRAGLLGVLELHDTVELALGRVGNR